MCMPKKEETKKESDEFRPSELIGISEKRADEIIDVFIEAVKSTDTWTEAYRKVIKDVKIKNNAEAIYIGFVFGKRLEQQERKEKLHAMAHLLGHILG